jgi:hypothetical protein
MYLSHHVLPPLRTGAFTVRNPGLLHPGLVGLGIRFQNERGLTKNFEVQP